MHFYFNVLIFFGGEHCFRSVFTVRTKFTGAKRSGRGSGPIGLIDGATASEQSLVGANGMTGLSG